MPTWAWVSIAVGVWSLLLAIILRGRGMLRGSDAPASDLGLNPSASARVPLPRTSAPFRPNAGASWSSTTTPAFGSCFARR